jgi:hypothetical protein
MLGRWQRFAAGKESEEAGGICSGSEQLEVGIVQLSKWETFLVHSEVGYLETFPA